MKIFAFTGTIAAHILAVISIKLLDGFGLIILIFCTSLFVGIALKTGGKSKKMQDIGWGLLCGSLTSLALVLLFMLWLSYNFPK